MDSKYVLINKPLVSPVISGNFSNFNTKRKLITTIPLDSLPKKFKTAITNDITKSQYKIIHNNTNKEPTSTIGPTSTSTSTSSTNNKQHEFKTPEAIASPSSVHLAAALQQQRQKLPIYGCRQRFIFEAKKVDTLLLMGETGCGKTTQMPQFLYDAGYAKYGQIAITQPRRVAAITIAKRVAQEMNCRLGELVGFTVRFEDCTSILTKIKYITDGSLLREALSDNLLKKYSVIMLDEVHERTINTDVLFGIVKEAQRQRNNKLCGYHPLKVIVTSATMDIDHFGQYFGVKGMYLEGRTFPVRVMHATEEHPDYVHACLVTLFKIHRTTPLNHDILIFLTGQEEIESAAHEIRMILKSGELENPFMRVFPLYSQLPQNKQLECFLPSSEMSRKVILATNIAETSITIPGIRYVIDSGYVKRRMFDPLSGMESLKIVRISKAQSWQRCGRAGREADGICYRAYTQAEMEQFDEMPKPEILRSNITATVLQLIALGIDCKTFDFIDKPSNEAIDNAYKQLSQLGAIKNLNSTRPDLTGLGRKMAMFPLDPRFSKLLLVAPDFNCLDEMLSLVAVMSGENVFITPAAEKQEQAILAHAKFESKSGDHLTMLNVFSAFLKTDKIKLWCQDNYLNTRNLLYARDVRQQLEEICIKRCELTVTSCGENVNLIKKCLLSALFVNIAELQQRDNVYITIGSRQRAQIHPSSVLSSKPKPSWLIFTEFLTTEKSFLRMCTEIEPGWIEEIVPNYQYINRVTNPIYS